LGTKEKICPVCKKKFITPYPFQKYCSKECKKIADRPLSRLRNKRWRERNPERAREISRNWRKRHPIKRREAWLKFKYGLTWKEYLQMRKEQQGRCAICGVKFGRSQNTKAHVDHDHKTNKVRKLLCGRCNRVLGLVNEDIKILENMIKYLEEFRND